MFAFLICMIGVAATGGSLVSSGPYRNMIVYGIMACLLVSYVYHFAVRKKVLQLNMGEKFLFGFITIGIVYVLLSYVGLNREFNKLEFEYDKSFIPRQAFYYFILPAIFLFQDDFYTKGKEYILDHYGPALFWGIYIFWYFYGKSLALVAPSFLLMSWLALRIKSPQTWRNWIRVAFLILSPLPRDGSSTVIILRMIMLALIVIPAGWNREWFKWMAVGLFIVLIAASFIVPSLITDTSFISDYNTKWRLDYWIDSMKNLGYTYGLGVGYGTSYISKTLGKILGFYANSMHSTYELYFVRGNHNSLVSVAMRTGILGISIFLLFMICMLWEMLRYKALPSKAAVFALFGGMVCIAFNVGLESPHYLFSFIFCMGECNQEIKKLRQESRYPGLYARKVWNASLSGT